MGLRFKLLPGGKLPTYGSDGAAGLDCYALEGGTIPGHTRKVQRSADMVEQVAVPISRARVSLGFCIEIPMGYVGIIHPRSSLGLKHGIAAGIGACVIDEDYRGAVTALLFNLGSDDYTWTAGERVCQLLIQPVLRLKPEQVEELTETKRGDGGFGSSGTH